MDGQASSLRKRGGLVGKHGTRFIDMPDRELGTNDKAAFEIETTSIYPRNPRRTTDDRLKTPKCYASSRNRLKGTLRFNVKRCALNSFVRWARNTTLSATRSYNTD